MYADTIFIGGTILTMDKNLPAVDAVAVAGNKILAVGSSEIRDEHEGPDTTVVDLNGRVLLPGFVEAHGHPTMEMDMLAPGVLDLRASTCGSAEEVMQRLNDGVKEAESTGASWILAFGWDPMLLPDLPEISGGLLTELSPTIPMSVMHYSIHSSWANKAALEQLGFDSQTPNPEGSEYLRNENGELTGEALELPATTVLMGPEFAASPDKFNRNFAHELQRMAKVGVTTVGDLAFDPAKYSQMQEFMASNDLDVRVRAYEMSGVRAAPVTPEEAAQESSDLAQFRTVGIKVWTDGSPWVGNIATSFGYEDSPATASIGICAGHQGCSNYTEDQLREICRTNFSRGWQMACHVHGDIAVDMVLDVYEQIQKEFPRNDARLRMEHCGAITREQVTRAHDLGVTISFFVAHIHYYGDVLDQLFGEKAQEWTPVGAAAACGMRFSLHNDPPVTPESPLLNMQAAMTRKTPSGKVLGADLRIGIEDALKAQTIDAAWQLHSDHEVGSIEAGKYADFVILDQNPLEVEADKIGDIAILETWTNGKQVYGAPESQDLVKHLDHLPLTV